MNLSVNLFMSEINLIRKLFSIQLRCLLNDIDYLGLHPVAIHQSTDLPRRLFAVRKIKHRMISCRTYETSGAHYMTSLLDNFFSYNRASNFGIVVNSVSCPVIAVLPAKEAQWALHACSVFDHAIQTYMARALCAFTMNVSVEKLGCSVPWKLKVCPQYL